MKMHRKDHSLQQQRGSTFSQYFCTSLSLFTMSMFSVDVYKNYKLDILTAYILL